MRPGRSLHFVFACICGALSLFAQPAPVTLVVDTAQCSHPISPDSYGINEYEQTARLQVAGRDASAAAGEVWQYSQPDLPFSPKTEETPSSADIICPPYSMSLIVVR